VVLEWQAVHRSHRVLRGGGKVLRRLLSARSPIHDCEREPGGDNCEATTRLVLTGSPPLHGWAAQLPANRLQISRFVLHALNADRVARPVIAGVRRHTDGTFLSCYVRLPCDRVRIGLGASCEKPARGSDEEGEPPKTCSNHFPPPR